MPRHELPELSELEAIASEFGALFSIRTLGETQYKGGRFPIYALALGSDAPSVPAVGFFGGIHGLERIGTQVLLAFLRNFATRMLWDRVLRDQMEFVRLIFMPLVNPAGMWGGTRCNPRGVDLMRNAPIASAERVPPLIGFALHPSAGHDLPLDDGSWVASRVREWLSP